MRGVSSPYNLYGSVTWFIVLVTVSWNCTLKLNKVGLHEWHANVAREDLRFSFHDFLSRKIDQFYKKECISVVQKNNFKDNLGLI